MDFLNKVFDFSKKKRPELKNAAIIQFKVLRLQNVYIKCFALNSAYPSKKTPKQSLQFNFIKMINQSQSIKPQSI